MDHIPPDEETEPFPGPVDDVPFENPAPDWDRYAIIEFVGEGGMGVVYRAIDRKLERTVALKFLRSREALAIARFQREARAQARLDHEHVCRVFEVGEVNGCGFIAMQFIEGEVLRSPDNRLDLEEKLEVMEQVARAIQAAHGEGVIHRDLKPGNIMVERRHDGRLHAYVLDFGIADDSAEPDDEAQALPTGTAAFMAPERICSDGRALDHRVDVYGLGATLYAALAEQAPFFGESRTETKEKVLNERPIRLGLVVPGTSEDLETIVEVAMAKEPARRYPSAKAFADDLGRWLEGKPIKTRRAGPFYRLGTWIRTRKTAAAFLALVLVTAGAAAGSALWLRYRENQRLVLVAQHQNEVEQIDRLLRRARMMPLHDTAAAEDAARTRLAAVEASLLEHGPLASGPAYYALGFGHLMLREFDTAVEWLEAAVDSGFVEPEVESALGIAQAMRMSTARGVAGPTPDGGDPEVAEIRRHLARSGPETADRDHFHRAMAFFVEGRLDEALISARESTAAVPWLYEAIQLEGDILVARALQRLDAGDLEGAEADFYHAGDAYARGLGIARSDPWLYEAEAVRLLKLAEHTGGDSVMAMDLVDRAIEAATAAGVALPNRAHSLELASMAYLVKAELLGRHGGEFSFELAQARRLAESANELDPDNTELDGLRRRTDALLRESRGANTG